MRAFHLNWWGFFCAFFIWFGISPLLGEISESLDLDREQIWTSSIVSVGVTIPLSLALGPLCDKFGARILLTAVLCLAAIPTACTGLIHSATDLIFLRFGIGIVGGSVVM